MNIHYKKPVCPKCSHNVLYQGSQNYTKECSWATLKEISENKIELSNCVPYVWIADPTSLKCVNCSYQLSFDECEKIIGFEPMSFHPDIRNEIVILEPDEE